MADEVQHPRCLVAVAIDAAPSASTDLTIPTNTLPGSSHRLSGAEYSALKLAKEIRARLGGPLVALCVGRLDNAVLSCNEALLCGADAAYVVYESESVVLNDQSQRGEQWLQARDCNGSTTIDSVTAQRCSNPSSDGAIVMAAAMSKLGVRFLLCGDYSNSDASGSFALRAAVAANMTLLSGVETLTLDAEDTTSRAPEMQDADPASLIEVHMRLNESLHGTLRLPSRGAVLSCRPVFAQPPLADLQRRFHVQAGETQADYLPVSTSQYRSTNLSLTAVERREPPSFRAAPPTVSAADKTRALLDAGSPDVTATRHIVRHLNPDLAALSIVEDLRSWGVLKES